MKSYSPIGTKLSKLENEGLQPTKKMKVLKELGGEDALDFVNALESDRLIFVEGKYDPLYIQTIIDKKYINNNLNIMYWGFEGVNNIFKNENWKLSKLFSVLLIFYYVLKFTRISEFGLDLPSAIYSNLSILFFIKFFETDNTYEKKKFFFLNLNSSIT